MLREQQLLNIVTPFIAEPRHFVFDKKCFQLPWCVTSNCTLDKPSETQEDQEFGEHVTNFILHIETLMKYYAPCGVSIVGESEPPGLHTPTSIGRPAESFVDRSDLSENLSMIHSADWEVFAEYIFSLIIVLASTHAAAPGKLNQQNIMFPQFSNALDSLIRLADGNETMKSDDSVQNKVDYFGDPISRELKEQFNIFDQMCLVLLKQSNEQQACVSGLGSMHVPVDSSRNGYFPPVMHPKISELRWKPWRHTDHTELARQTVTKRDPGLAKGKGGEELNELEEWLFSAGVRSYSDNKAYSKSPASTDSGLSPLTEGHSALPRVPADQRDFLCYPLARYPENHNPLLPLSLQKKLGKSITYVIFRFSESEFV